MRKLFVTVPAQGVHCIPVAAHRLLWSIVGYEVEALAQYSQHVDVRFVCLPGILTPGPGSGS